MKVQDEVDKAQEAVEAMVSSTPQRVLEFDLIAASGALEHREYMQAPLGFFPVQQFTTLMTSVIKGFMNGDYGISLGQLFSSDIQKQVKMPTEFTEQAADKLVQDNEQLIKAFLHLMEVLPELQADVIALSLGVSGPECDWFKQAIAEPPHRGGLSIDDGFDLIKTFIVQNAREIRRFFAQKGRELVETIQLEVLDQEPTIVQDEPSAGTPGGTPSSTGSLSMEETD